MRVGYINFRIAGNDGVSLEASHWRDILEVMGAKVYFIAGELDQKGLLIPELHFSHPDVYKIHEMVISNNVNYKKVEAEIFALSGKIEGILRQEFRQLDIDQLIVSNVFSLPIHLSLAVALERLINEFKIPTISRNHDFWWERQRYLKSHCFEFFQRWFPPESQFIKHVTINSLAQKELKKRTGIQSLVIPDTFDFNSKLNILDDYSSNWRRDFNIKEDDLVFLQATRIIPRKNIEASIELVKKLNDARIILILVGQTGDEGDDYLERLKFKAKKAHIRVRFIRNKVKSEREIINGERIYTLWDCFNNCNLSTYPSIFEGFGNQFLEAVYFKKPIFVNRYSVFKADIEPLGFEVIKINDGQVTQTSVDQIRSLLNNPAQIQKQVNKNFEIAKKYFSYEATAQKLMKLGLKP